jgi:hypothetical protein
MTNGMQQPSASWLNQQMIYAYKARKAHGKIGLKTLKAA